MVFGVSTDYGEKVSLCTCVAGALEDRCGPSVMRAAARGSEELMSTGALISIECRLFPSTCAERCVMLSAVNECRFLAFFFPSACLCAPFPLQLTASALADDLSISISCFAVSFS